MVDMPDKLLAGYLIYQNLLVEGLTVAKTD